MQQNAKNNVFVLHQRKVVNFQFVKYMDLGTL